jgi:hypothetical protein
VIDQFRERLSALDPMRGVAIDPVDSDRARNLLEAVMSRPLTDSPADVHVDTSPARPARSTRRWSLITGVVGLAAAAVVAVAVVADNDSGTSTATPPLALSLPAGDSMAMCMAIDASMLDDSAEIAFAGTVSSVGDGVVALDVDRWYRGGDASSVEVSTGEGFTVALDGVDFVAGSRYLVTASAGQVLGCGMSGVATPELEQLFDTAFSA